MTELELFAGIAVSDFARAVAWYERLLGKPATFEAHPTEHVWTLADGRSIYVELRPDRAGAAMVTFFVDDLDGVADAAAGRGIHPEHRETYGNGVRKVVYLDPDGNEIGFGGAPLDAGKG
jgi:catechol 2,3-dioxygenase-like lactoylglutathione lyase family enzyme